MALQRTDWAPTIFEWPLLNGHFENAQIKPIA